MESKSNSTDIINKQHEPENDITKLSQPSTNLENNNTQTNEPPSLDDNESKPTDSEAVTSLKLDQHQQQQQQQQQPCKPEIEKNNSLNIETDKPQNESVTNASTEVQLDESTSDCLHIRLAGLNVSGDDTPTKPDQQKQTVSTEAAELTSTAETNCNEINKHEKSADLTRSILAGEVSDNSERSVQIDDDDEPSNYIDDKPVSGSVSDEEMFIEDQEEDVEEEEEFHEVEEEKHKTSQESVGSGTKNSPASHPNTRVKSRTDAESENLKESKQSANEEAEETKTPADTIKSDASEDSKTQANKNTDWADMMLSNIQGGNEAADEKSEADEPTPGTDGKQEEVEVEKKELDLDEDVKNPQYIPKKGVFYEHDDRSHDLNSKKQPTATTKKDDESSETKDASNNKKSGPQEKQNDNRRGRRPRAENDRWNHDLFREEKQKPKSKSELINAYGYDIRPRDSRNQTDGRQPRGNSNSNVSTNANTERQQSGQDNRTSRQTRDNRTPRQNLTQNRSRERRPRRQNNNRSRPENATNSTRRDATNSKPVKVEAKDVKQDFPDAKHGFQQLPQPSAPATRRDNQDGLRERNVRADTRNESRGKRQSNDDRPTNNPVDDKLPPINTVMPPITTWSNKIEDMVKEEASRKESPSRQHPQHSHVTNNNVKSRSNEYWSQNQPNKNVYHDRSVRNNDEGRQQTHYNARRYPDRDDTYNKSAQFVNRNHYNDRSNQHHQEWRRTNNYNSFVKTNDYEPIKTQTFENSRLSQTNMNRFRPPQDAREIINERRLQAQQNFQSKAQPNIPGTEQRQQHQLVHQQQQHHQMMQHHHHHQELIQHHQHQQQQQQQPQQQQAAQHMRQHQQPSSSQQASQNQSQAQPPQPSAPTSQQMQNQQLQNQNQRQQQQQQQQQQISQTQQHQNQQRQNLVMNSMSDGVTESGRLNSNNSNASDILSSRPIIKTDSYTSANVGPHSQQPQPLQQHSQNHRSLGGPMSQQGPNSTATHLVPSHLNAAGTQAQYYPPSSNTRDTAAAAAALATAYHGYLPGGHSVMEPTRYHMTSQQLSDHGYMASPGQTNDVAAASVIHQQGMYTDATSTGGTVASSAYLAQAGSTLSPSTNIPVTGAGPPPLAPVSYLQHSQYPPPPYSNPYTQPQHNQAPPPQSTAYPYWTYI